MSCRSIGRLDIGPIHLDLTFHLGDGTGLLAEVLPDLPGFGFVSGAIEAAGATLAHLDAAPIRISALHAAHLFETTESLVGRIAGHVLQQALFQLYKLAGSAEFLGNPIGLVSGVGRDVATLIRIRKRGAVGAASGGGGQAGSTAVATVVLVRNIGTGVIDSAVKVLGSLSKGLKQFNLEEAKPIQARGRAGRGHGGSGANSGSLFAAPTTLARYPPRGIIEGVSQGSVALGLGFWTGVTGLFLDPFRGLRRGLLFGVRGLAAGVLGVATKPTTGILDAAVLTLQGVSTQVNSRTRLARQRIPRFIPPSTGVIGEYSRRDAEGAARLLLAHKAAVAAAAESSSSSGSAAPSSPAAGLVSSAIATAAAPATAALATASRRGGSASGPIAYVFHAPVAAYRRTSMTGAAALTGGVVAYTPEAAVQLLQTLFLRAGGSGAHDALSGPSLVGGGNNNACSRSCTQGAVSVVTSLTAEMPGDFDYDPSLSCVPAVGQRLALRPELLRTSAEAAAAGLRGSLFSAHGSSVHVLHIEAVHGGGSMRGDDDGAGGASFGGLRGVMQHLQSSSSSSSTQSLPAYLSLTLAQGGPQHHHGDGHHPLLVTAAAVPAAAVSVSNATGGGGPVLASPYVLIVTSTAALLLYTKSNTCVWSSPLYSLEVVTHAAVAAATAASAPHVELLRTYAPSASTTELVLPPPSHGPHSLSPSTEQQQQQQILRPASAARGGGTTSSSSIAQQVRPASAARSGASSRWSKLQIALHASTPSPSVAHPAHPYIRRCPLVSIRTEGPVLVLNTLSTGTGFALLCTTPEDAQALKHAISAVMHDRGGGTSSSSSSSSSDARASSAVRVEREREAERRRLEEERTRSERAVRAGVHAARLVQATARARVTRLARLLTVVVLPAILPPEAADAERAAAFPPRELDPLSLLPPVRRPGAAATTDEAPVLQREGHSHVNGDSATAAAVLRGGEGGSGTSSATSTAAEYSAATATLTTQHVNTATTLAAEHVSTAITRDAPPAPLLDAIILSAYRSAVLHGGGGSGHAPGHSRLPSRLMLNWSHATVSWLAVAVIVRRFIAADDDAPSAGYGAIDTIDGRGDVLSTDAAQHALRHTRTFVVHRSLDDLTTLCKAVPPSWWATPTAATQLQQHHPMSHMAPPSGVSGLSGGRPGNAAATVTPATTAVGSVPSIAGYLSSHSYSSAEGVEATQGMLRALLWAVKLEAAAHSEAPSLPSTATVGMLHAEAPSKQGGGRQQRNDDDGNGPVSKIQPITSAATAVVGITAAATAIAAVSRASSSSPTVSWAQLAAVYTAMEKFLLGPRELLGTL